MKRSVMERKCWRSLFAVFLTLVMVLQLASPIFTFAAVSDADTSDRYHESLGDDASTEYAGRVWTDKSVFTNNVTFDTYGGGTSTILLEPEKEEDFLISYSALATSQSISGQSQVPVDVVLILDISGSMSNASSNMDNGRSRIYNTVQAANAAIDSLMNMNPNTRVAVVVFSTNAQVLLPLDRYTKISGYNYLSVSRSTASSNNATLTVRANNGRSVINTTVDVQGGTNIQVGLYEGMKLLTDEAVTTATVNGTTVKRAPSVILLSDGSPTYSSNSTSWWAPADNANDGPGNGAYAGNGFKAILTGAYMKSAIDRNYGVAGTAYATTVYTVGMGITNLTDAEKNLANMTLNPGYYWDNGGTNAMKTAIKNYWSAYTANGNTGTLNVNVGQQGWTTTDKNYRVTHPNTGYDLNPTNGYDYVDDYYGADNASAVTDVFQQIVSSISIAAPQVPTEIKGDDPLTDGYITYTDPIGKYMEVKDVKSIIYAGQTFSNKQTSTAGNVTTYTFSGEVHSPVYGDQNINHIIITVEADANGDEVLTVKIPASVIPLRLNTVLLNPDGSVKSHTNNGAFPTRVIYSVGLKDGIRKVSDDGHEYIDITKVSQEYLLANANTDGTINFYSNVYTGANMVHGYTAGDAKVEFEPSHSNSFYYILEDMPIYKDREFKQQLTAQEGIDADTVYYYKEEYYHGNDTEVAAIARTGAQLTLTEITTGADGCLYRAAGSPRLNRILEFEGTKTENMTGTAQDFYAPSFVHAEGSSDPFDGKFVIYHGNNGVLNLAAGGNLEIRKEVAAAAGLTAPGETFTFTVSLSGINGSEYTYVIRDAQQNRVSTGTVSQSNNTISLTDGQSATIYALPPMTAYEITEAAVSGFASESQGASGVIHAGLTQQAVFTNTYSVSPVESEELTGSKRFEGRNWESGDSFTFFLTPYNNCPLPEGYDPQKGVTVSTPDTAGGQEASFSFGKIKFTAPGLYRYTVVESEPASEDYLPGVTYSRALYRVAILVEDNGDGTLKIVSSDIQRLSNDAAEPLFTYGSNNEIVMNAGQEAKDEIRFVNTYNASSVIRVPTAVKEYSDPSGTKPLVSGMFQFRLKAIGYQLDGGELQTDITNVPMPEGAVNGEIVTTNEGHNVTFPHVEFAQDIIPQGAEYISFRYEMSEVIPDEKVPGMVYDETVYTVDVKVEIDHTSDELKISAIYPNQERVATFKNRFEMKPATADIDGSKTLNGRDMLDGESFVFTLVGADAATNNAVRDGIVEIPDSEVSVSGGKNGKKKAFSFENIRFLKPGTYTFLVSEVPGSAPAVIYDSSNISVTFEIADRNGDAKLDIVSVTYSNGGDSADFVNTYTYQFNDAAVSLEGTKKLIGKSLLEGEFYFKVQELYNGKEIAERLVGNTGDDTASDGVYSGKITFLKNATYTEAGTYQYIISEQIPDDDHKVHGTQYDTSVFRYTVVVADDGAGNLTVASKKLEKKNGNSWESADSIVFTNKYVPDPATAQIPLIRKVLTGDRVVPLQENEFRFRLALVSATNEDGILLPDTAVVGNAANGDILFDNITFTKAGEYTVSITEVIPDEADRVPGISYSQKTITATFVVVDNRNGILSAALTQFIGGDTITNNYTPQPISATISAKKELIGGQLNAEDFKFSLYETDASYSIEGLTPLKTLGNGADGTFSFSMANVPQLQYTAVGTHYYVLVEEQADPIEGIRYDTTAYRYVVTVEDGGLGILAATVECVNGDKDNVVFRNVAHDKIVEKEVVASGTTVQLDGAKVSSGQLLTYTIRYKNYTGKVAEVTITDAIPVNTTFVSATDGGVYESGQVKWTVSDIAPENEISVSVTVKVNKTTEPVENTAVVLEGNNTFQTNTVTTSVEDDVVSKNVYLSTAPTVSVDGQKVEAGDVLVYAITYQNTSDAPGEVTITDKLPANTTFVSAADGGVLEGDTVTWKFALGAKESKTVTFKVKVKAADVFIDNQATAVESGNEIQTNIVTNHTYEEAGSKDVVRPAQPSVSIDGKAVTVGETLQYVISYTNTTGAPVDLTITDEIPAHTELVAGTAGDATVEGNKLVWTRLNLQPRETVTVTFRVVVKVAGDKITNQAMVYDGTNKVTNQVANSVPAKTVDKETASAGEVLTYTVTYLNTTGAAADVVITDRLDSKLEYVEGSAEGATYAAGVLTWEVENVPAGERVTVSFQAKLSADVTADAIANVVQIVENDVNIVTTNSATTQVLKPELTIRKLQAVGSGNATTEDLNVVRGNEVTYTLIVKNIGQGAAQNVVITDAIPEGLRFVEGSANLGGTLESGTLSWKLDTLAPNEEVTLTFRVKVPYVQEDTAWNNIAAVTGANSDESVDSNEVTILVKVPTNPVTGDNFRMLTFIGMLILSSFGLAAVMVSKKRSEKEETENN